jgi:wobble nucleotide-excising tRNase
MIKKILSIVGIGRFQDCHGQGDVEFRRLTLIFADNAGGKTTLCDVFRSLQSGDVSLIHGRRTLGATNGPEASIRLVNETASFRNGTWSHTTAPDIAVYDSKFIHENIYAGESMVHGHRKNLYRVIIGEEGVLLAQRIDALDERSRQLNREIANRETSIIARKPAAMTLDAFIALENRDTLAQDLATSEATVRALRNTAELLSRPGPQPATPFLPFPEGFGELLDRSLEQIASDLEQTIHAHMQRCLRTPDQAWLSRGVALSLGEHCPFCGQDLATSALRSSLSAYFSEEYRRLKSEVESLASAVNGFASDGQRERFAREVERNDTAADYWSRYVEGTRPAINSEDISRAALSLRTQAQSLVGLKQHHLVEAVARTTEFSDALSAYNAALATIEQYNRQVTQFNTLVTAKQAEIQRGNLAREQAILERLQATRDRYETFTATKCTERAALRLEKDQAVLDKQAARTALDRYSEAVFQRYETAINDFLDKFGAGFRIGETSPSHMGGTPSTNFKLVINAVAVDLGDDSTPLGRPSFRNTLSAGDRSSLALAFFLAQAFRDPNVSQRIFVLDDPFTSQDRSRRTWTGNEIRNLARVAKQVVVLSHDPHFLKDIASEMPIADTKTLQIAHFGATSLIEEWSTSDECLEQHAKDHKTLLQFRDSGLGNPDDVRARIRPLLENYLFMKLPDQFPENTTLGGMIGTIRQAEPTDPKAAAQSLLSELEPINEYALATHHRARSQSVQTDSVELRAFVVRALRLVRGF